MRDFHCSETGMSCDFVAKGSTDDEVLAQVGPHAEQTHGMKVTPELERTVRGLIHDESSEAHRRAMAARRS